MKRRVLWRLLDGRAGHAAQSLGLARALERRLPLDVIDIPVTRRWRPALDGFAGRWPPGEGLPAPDLLIGAGQSAQINLLAARHAFGGRAVLLMRPVLPVGWFDLCLIPQHDHPPSRSNVIVTRGMLNPARPAAVRDPGLGLILLGGPGRHFGWDEGRVLDQLRALVARRPGRDWRLVVSRRTPARMCRAVTKIPGLRLAENGLRGDALYRLMGRAGEIHVSEDSLSMIWEALTAGAPTGLIGLRRPARPTRLTRAVDALLAEGLVAAPGTAGRPPAPPGLDEAGRCADWIRDRWLKED